MRRPNRSGRLALALACASAIVLALAACGKKGAPEPPEGSTYPRTYPQPSSMILEGDLLETTRTIQDGGGIRGGVEVYQDDVDFPDRGGFDETEAEEGSAEDSDEENGGVQ